MSRGFRTPVTFSREEIAEIRVMLSTWEKPPICPKCEIELTVEEVGEEQLKRQLHVSCQVCNRTGFILM